MGAVRVIAAVGACAAFAALLVQYAILYGDLTGDGATPLAATWRYFGFFTILTNLLVAAIWTRLALRGEARDGLNGARVEGAAAMAIVMVGLVYHLLLAHLWDPQGWQLATDVVLHTGTPALFAIYWLARPRGALKWAHAGLFMLWPLGYCVYALSRGAFDGWYAYPFLDPTSSTLSELAVNIASLSAGFAIAALAVVALDKTLCRAPVPSGTPDAG